MNTNESEKYWNAKEHEKDRERSARNAAIIRSMNEQDDLIHEMRVKLNISRATLLVAIAVNFYIAAQHAGVL